MFTSSPYGQYVPQVDVPDVTTAFNNAGGASAYQVQRQSERGSSMVENDAPALTPKPPPHVRYHIDKSVFDRKWQDEQLRHNFNARAAPLPTAPITPSITVTFNNRSLDMTDTTHTKNNAPLHKFRDGGLSLTVWENKNANGDFYQSVSLQKSYKAQDGSFRTSKSFSPHDLEKLQAMIPQAQEFIAQCQEQRRDQAQEKTQAQAQPEQSTQTAPAQDLEAAHKQAMQEIELPAQQQSRNLERGM